MGVRFLKSIIENHCKNAYTTLSLFSLTNQTVIIDTNIFMYKFKSLNTLETSFMNMLDKFIKYNINPIFVFDGIPSSDKNYTIESRKKKRDISNKIAYSIKQKISNTTQKNYLKSLKKKLKYHESQSTKLYSRDFITIKNIINSYNFHIIQANNEADELCAEHNINNHSYAVITEDTDLLVYGSPFVIINIDFNNDIFDIIHTKSLLNTLDIKSIFDFQQICILSGTDYNKAFDIYIALCLYSFYIQTKYKSTTFLHWCYYNNFISKKQLHHFINILDKYSINQHNLLNLQERQKRLLAV